MATAVDEEVSFEGFLEYMARALPTLLEEFGVDDDATGAFPAIARLALDGLEAGIKDGSVLQDPAARRFVITLTYDEWATLASKELGVKVKKGCLRKQFSVQRKRQKDRKRRIVIRFSQGREVRAGIYPGEGLVGAPPAGQPRQVGFWVQLCIHEQPVAVEPNRTGSSLHPLKRGLEAAAAKRKRSEDILDFFTLPLTKLWAGEGLLAADIVKTLVDHEVQVPRELQLKAKLAKRRALVLLFALISLVAGAEAGYLIRQAVISLIASTDPLKQGQPPTPVPNAPAPDRSIAIKHRGFAGEVRVYLLSANKARYEFHMDPASFRRASLTTNIRFLWWIRDGATTSWHITMQPVLVHQFLTPFGDSQWDVDVEPQEYNSLNITVPTVLPEGLLFSDGGQKEAAPEVLANVETDRGIAVFRFTDDGTAETRGSRGIRTELLESPKLGAPAHVTFRNFRVTAARIGTGAAGADPLLQDIVLTCPAAIAIGATVTLDFGDGTTGSDVSTAAPWEPTIERFANLGLRTYRARHQYQSPGTYSVAATVVNPQGATEVARETITVQ